MTNDWGWGREGLSVAPGLADLFEQLDSGVKQTLSTG